MSFQDIDLAKIRVAEALKMGLESQRIHRLISGSKSINRESKQAYRRANIEKIWGFILQYRQIFYCRFLSFVKWS